MKISREIKTAVLVLSGIALFVYLYTFLKGEDLFTDEETYYTIFDYNALSMSSAVTVKGNKVGKVEKIKYDFKTGKTVVSFSVSPQLEFSKNSIIRLYETGIMGGNALAIVNAYDNQPAKPGDTLTSEVQPGLISTLKKNFSGLSTDLDATIRTADNLMTRLNTLVTDESEDGIKRTIAELNQTLKAFKYLSNDVQQLIQSNDDKIATVLDNFSKTSEDINALTTELRGAEISKTITGLDTIVSNLNRLVVGLNQGQGTIGKLLKEDQIYDNLEAASKELEMLLKDIKLHPARYRRILSKREIPYQKPEEEN